MPLAQGLFLNNLSKWDNQLKICVVKIIIMGITRKEMTIAFKTGSLA